MTWLRVRDWIDSRGLDLAEAVFVLLALFALASLTATVWALLVGGVLGVVACERASTTRKQRGQQAAKRHLERVA